jgi:hypothetical protein
MAGQVGAAERQKSFASFLQKRRLFLSAFAAGRRFVFGFFYAL